METKTIIKVFDAPNLSANDGRAKKIEKYECFETRSRRWAERLCRWRDNLEKNKFMVVASAVVKIDFVY